MYWLLFLSSLVIQVVRAKYPFACEMMRWMDGSLAEVTIDTRECIYFVFILQSLLYRYLLLLLFHLSYHTYSIEPQQSTRSIVE